MSLPKNLEQLFVESFLHVFQDDEQLVRRFAAVYPLYGLKWCLILLDEFIPESLRRRELSGSAELDQAGLQYNQLAKARNMLSRITGEFEHFPY